MTYTRKQAADKLGISEKTVYYYTGNGKLPVGDDGLITDDALAEFQRQRDPDLQLWQDIKAWVDAGGEVRVDSKQLSVALKNRVKVNGRRLGEKTAKQLKVSRERVRHLLNKARQAYAESIISKAYK